MRAPEITLEIRWFFPGTIPQKEVKDWFLNNTRFGERLTGKQGKEREDLYLLTPGSTDLGPKLREGRFEIKVLQHPPEIVVIENSASGKSELWHKWKWPYAKGKKDSKINDLVTNSFLSRTPRKLRVTVWKKRWQRKFMVTGPGELAPAPKDQKDLTWWINAEIAGLRVKGASWWTLALEVCENPDPQLPLLQQSLSWVLQDYSGPPLAVDNSYSYPEWLANL